MFISQISRISNKDVAKIIAVGYPVPVNWHQPGQLPGLPVIIKGWFKQPVDPKFDAILFQSACFPIVDECLNCIFCFTVISPFSTGI
jgi:hypothetical protein